MKIFNLSKATNQTMIAGIKNTFVQNIIVDEGPVPTLEFEDNKKLPTAVGKVEIIIVCLDCLADAPNAELKRPANKGITTCLDKPQIKN